MATLHRAVAVAEDPGVTFTISKDLYFHVTGQTVIALEIESTIAKGNLCFLCSLRGKLFELVEVSYQANTATATAVDGFDEQREAEFLAQCAHFAGVIDLNTLCNRNICINGNQSSTSLISHSTQCFRARASKGNTFFFKKFTQLGLFTQEAIARVNNGCAGVHGGLRHLLWAQVREVGLSGTNHDDPVSCLGGRGVGVSNAGGKNRRCANAASSRDDAHRNLAAVCDEDDGLICGGHGRD